MRVQAALLGAAVVTLGALLPGARGPTQVAAQSEGRTLKQIAVIDLPGPPGKRFDYLTIDDGGNQLFAAHLAAGRLYVIDLTTSRLVKVIPDVPGVEGVAYIAEGRKLYTSDWYENKVGVVDLTQMKVVKRIPTEKKPDGIAYAAPYHKAYVSDERAKAEVVIDTREDRVLTTLRFDSETGVPQYDPVARRVYVNLQDRNMLAVIDPSSDGVTARYPVAGCEGNHGMAIDSERHRAFLACEGNDVLTIFDLDKHEAIAHLPMAKGADVVAFDPGLARIYVACSSGAISVFQVEGSNHFRKLEDFPVQRKVHSLAVDPRTHRVYAPEEQADGRPVARMIVYEAVGADRSAR